MVHYPVGVTLAKRLSRLPAGAWYAWGVPLRALADAGEVVMTQHSALGRHTGLEAVTPSCLMAEGQ